MVIYVGFCLLFLLIGGVCFRKCRYIEKYYDLVREPGMKPAYYDNAYGAVAGFGGFIIMLVFGAWRLL